METLLPQLQKMQEFFASRATCDYDFRRQQLIKLKQTLLAHEQEIYQALFTDLKKGQEESWVTEIGVIITEINYALKKLKAWMRPKRVKTNLLNFPSRSYILSEPLGVALIIGPWNYPLQLLLTPLVGAIAAGNCVVVKPSELAPATAAILEKIIKNVFEEHYVLLVQGEGAEVIPAMMNNFRFDHVFYTGSTTVGQLIYKMAAQKLVPATLELGGKSPCIVESDANIKVSAKRIALTKFSNAGQMCVAPDYLLVHEKIRDEFLEELIAAIESFYTKDPNHAKIINQKEFERLLTHIDSGTIVFGGNFHAEKLFIAPTILTNVSLDSPVMNEEIFGPLLPIISWRDESEVYSIIEKHSNPLALYVFTSSNAKAEKWTRTISFGGGCVNNASLHFTNHHLPFGGRGNSGMGTYHGRFSFETFSHKKSIMKTPTWFDPSIKYPPFKERLNFFKKIVR